MSLSPTGHEPAPAHDRSRCPSCASSVRLDEPWCSLCHANLRSHREPQVSAGLPEDAVPAMDAELVVAEPEAGDGVPQPDPVDVRRAADAMLAELAATESAAGGTSLPVVGDRLDSGAARAVVAVVGALVVMLAMFALLAGLGALL